MAEILVIAEGEVFALKSARDNPFPSGQVHNQLPDAVCGRNRTRRRRLGIYPMQKFHERRSMPRLAIEGAFQFVNDLINLRHEINLALGTRIQRSAFRVTRLGSHSECLLLRQNSNSRCICGYDHRLSVNQETLAGVHGQGGCSRHMHHFDRFRSNDGNIEAHVLLRLCDLHHRQAAAGE